LIGNVLLFYFLSPSCRAFLHHLQNYPCVQREFGRIWNYWIHLDSICEIKICLQSFRALNRYCAFDTETSACPKAEKVI
jgi:hypothetical protein